MRKYSFSEVQETRNSKKKSTLMAVSGQKQVKYSQSRLKMTNRSLKGNMWSAIPVALLCMIVNWSERKQGSGPEGDEVL